MNEARIVVFARRLDMNLPCDGGCWCFDGTRFVIHNPNRRKGGSAIVICPKCHGTGQQPYEPPASIARE